MDDRFVWKASDIEFLSEEENRKELEKLRLYWQKRFLGKTIRKRKMTREQKVNLERLILRLSKTILIRE